MQHKTTDKLHFKFKTATSLNDTRGDDVQFITTNPKLM